MRTVGKTADASAVKNGGPKAARSSSVMCDFVGDVGQMSVSVLRWDYPKVGGCGFGEDPDLGSSHAQGSKIYPAAPQSKHANITDQYLSKNAAPYYPRFS